MAEGEGHVPGRGFQAGDGLAVCQINQPQGRASAIGLGQKQIALDQGGVLILAPVGQAQHPLIPRGGHHQGVPGPGGKAQAACRAHPAEARHDGHDAGAARGIGGQENALALVV